MYFTPYEVWNLVAPIADFVALLVSIGGPLEEPEGGNVDHCRSQDEKMGGKTSGSLSGSGAGEKEREEGLGRSKAKEEAMRSILFFETSVLAR